MKKSSMIKSIICLIVVLLITNFSMLGKVYAESKCTVTTQISATEMKKNDEFTLEVSISDIQSELGMMVFGATLDYDRESLSIEKMEGLNNWETPREGMSYNSKNGKIAITKSGFAKEDEAILKVTFKVTNKSKKNEKVGIKEISLSDGAGLIEVDDIIKDITVKNGKSTGKTIISVIAIIAIIFVIIYILKNSNNKKSRRR